MALVVMAEGKAKYVFYFIGDGMGVNQVNGTETYMAAVEGRIGTSPLCFAQFPYVGLVTTYSGTNGVTDSAAGGTALATGNKTKNGALGIKSDLTTRINSIAALAKSEGKAVGVTTSVSVDHATPASFYAHVKDRNMYHQIGKDLIESGKGIPTAYGVMFINEDIPMDIVYNGKHFPEYDYKGSLATVAVTCKGETEYLYLPCSIQDINHALTKLPAKTWEECECTLESSNFPAEDWNENSKSILANEGVYCLNNVCEAVRRLHDESDFEKLSAAMQMADVDDSGSIAVIANQLSDFIYIPDAEDNEDVGRYWIENIFGYEYDEALEDYIDFASFGEDVINDHDCNFLDTGGFIALEDGVSLDRMLEAAKAEKKFCENIAPPKPTPDDPNLITERFFFPLKYSVGTYNEYGDMDWEADAEDLNCSFGDRYESEIVNSFIKYTELDSCDMIEYFDQSESARAKIMSAKWGFDNIDGTLFGVVTAKLKEPLTGDEEEVFKDWILGQNSDGLGEGFEQQDIEIDDGILNVHFWNSSDEYYVENEDDFYNRMDNGMGGMM